MQKIKVSLIGYGYWGPKLARNFQNSNFFNLVSIIDTSDKNLKKAKKDFPLVQVSKNYNDVFSQMTPFQLKDSHLNMGFNSWK